MSPVHFMSKAIQPFQIVAHRGVRTDADHQRMAPENTIPAFKEAARQGAAIELDVIATPDGHIVVHHDFETGRMFKLPDKQKEVNQTSFSELQSASLNVEGHEQTVAKMLGANNGYTTPSQFKSVSIPELENVLDAAPDSHIYVELKTIDSKPGTPNPNNHLEEKVAKLIQENNLYDRVTVIGFSANSLRKIKKLDPKIKTGLNIDLPPAIQNTPAVLPLFMNFYVKHWVGADSFQPSYDDTTPELVEAAHKAGLPILPWVNHQTRDEEKTLFPKLMEMGVDGLITNSVDLLRQAADEKGLTTETSGAKNNPLYTKQMPLCYTESASANAFRKPCAVAG
jgi:glycerophosphoryl diester phosphodiesterase